jgi:hypothetical protein
LPASSRRFKNTRYINSPLAEERSTYLTHLALAGLSRSTLSRHARQLRVIAILLDKHVPSHVTLELISQCAWCRFMGWLKEKPRPVSAYGEHKRSAQKGVMGFPKTSTPVFLWGGNYIKL